MTETLRPKARPGNLNTTVGALDPEQSSPMASAPGPTPAHVAEAATASEQLPLHELQLIGLFRRASGPAALFRQADGAIVTAEVGTRLGAEEVTAIGDTGVVLAQGPTIRTMLLPAG